MNHRVCWICFDCSFQLVVYTEWFNAETIGNMTVGIQCVSKLQRMGVSGRKIRTNKSVRPHFDKFLFKAYIDSTVGGARKIAICHPVWLALRQLCTVTPGGDVRSWCGPSTVLTDIVLVITVVWNAGVVGRCSNEQLEKLIRFFCPHSNYRVIYRCPHSTDETPKVSGNLPRRFSESTSNTKSLRSKGRRDA